MSTNDTESPPSTSDGSALPNLFKRSYHQLDGAEDVAGNSSSSSPAGSERHKRARSEPRSETGASSAEAGSSAMESSAEPDTLSATLEQLAAMPGPSHSDHVDSAQRDTSFSNQYELSMERFNSFNEQIQPLREASPVVERHSPPSSENPHDEDEIMEQLFADPARSSQSWRDNHNSQPGLPGSSYAPYASLPHPEEVIEIVDARRNAEREVVVIEDSDDEVQIIDPPSRALFSGPADPPPSTSAPSYRAEDTWSGHWDTWNAGRNPWLDTPENEPNRFRTRHDSLPSSQLRDRPQPFTSGSSTERRTRLQSFNGAGTGRESNPWSNPYIYTPPSSLSLTAEEQEMFRHRRLADARRRMDEQRSEPPEREADVEEVLRRIRDASDRALSPFTIEEIQPSTRDSIPRPASPRTSIWPRAGARADSSISDFRTDARATSLEALRSATEMGNARIAEILASMDRDSSTAPTPSSVERLPRPSDSASANSESMHRSLVMEGLFNDNPDMSGTWRPASRRSVIVEEIQPGTSSNRPSSPQTARRSDRPQTNRPAPSRPPSWLTTTPASGSFEVRPRNPAITPSSTESSIASFVTADTSFEDNISLEQAASTAAAHAPAVSSPLRESYRAASPARPSPAPSAQPSATQSGTTVGGVNANDVVSRLQSLSGLLTSMAASPHASDAVRDSALRMLTSGHELMRAIDAERQPNPTRNAPSSSSGAADDASSSAGSLSSDRATTGRVRPYTPGSSVSASLGYAPDRHPGTGARLQALRSSLAASARASTPNRQRPSVRHTQVMDLSDRTRAEAFEPLGTSGASARNVQSTRNETLVNERSLRASEYLSQAEPDRTRRTEHIADRWSQARQRRRELQDALLAEEPRLQSLRRSIGRNSPAPSLYAMNRDGDSSRMDVDSEDEVEVLFNSGAFEGQEAMDVDREESLVVTPSRASVPTPTLIPGSSLNNTASRTVLRPPTAQSQSRVVLGGNHNPSNPRPRPPSTATAPHQVIDLSAYHDGPFRSALARAVEASRQNEQIRQRNQVAHTSQGQGRATPTRVERAEPSGTSNTSTSNTSTINVPRNRVRFVSLSDSATAAQEPQPTPSPSAPSRQSRRFESWMAGAGDEYARLDSMLNNSISGRDSTGRLPASRQELLQRLTSDSEARRNYRSTMRALHQGVGAGTGGRRHVPEYWDLLGLTDEPLLAALGRARHNHRGVPQSTIESLETGTYGEWANADTEEQCPICFEDYQSSDAVLRLPKCKHWFHKPCIEEWFKSAATCPICRDRVGESGQPAHHRPARVAPLGPSLSRIPPVGRHPISVAVQRNESPVRSFAHPSAVSHSSTAWRRLPREGISGGPLFGINLRREGTTDNANANTASNNSAPGPGPSASTATANATTGANDNGQRQQTPTTPAGSSSARRDHGSGAGSVPFPNIWEDDDVFDDEYWRDL